MEQRSKPISRLRSASIFCVPTTNASSASSALWIWIIRAGSQRSRQTSTYVVFPALSCLEYRGRRGFQEHRRRRLPQSRRDHHSGHPPCKPHCFSPPQPKDLKTHHAAAVDALRAKLKPRLLNAVKGDNSQTLVGFLRMSRKSHPQSLDIWAGTWNMGECDPPYNLEEWVPNSFDLIAVGVEECMSR